MVKKGLNLCISILAILAMVSIIRSGTNTMAWILLDIMVLLILIKSVIKYKKDKANTKSTVLEIVGLTIMLVGGILLAL